jgi:energy-coupling factor transporter ATP-binding protein EcfA2
MEEGNDILTSLLEKYEEKYNELYDTNTNDNNFVKTDPLLYFKLPIQYTNYSQLNDIIKDDLELNYNSNNLYTNLLLENNNLTYEMSSYYTTDKDFLKDTQKLIKYYKGSNYKIEPVLNEYTEFKNDYNFINKYQYVGFKYLKPFNHSMFFLQLLTMYNLSGPLFSLCAPLMGLIFPFIILKLQGKNVTIGSYIYFLKKALSSNVIYAFFSTFNNSSLQQKLSYLMSIFFYLLQIYNNITSTYRFYNNTNMIYNYIQKYKKHIHDSISVMDNMMLNMKNLSTYRFFVNDIMNHKENLLIIERQINKIIPINNLVSKITQIGYLLKIYYEMFNNISLHKSIMFSFYLCEYDNQLELLHQHIKNKKINKCSFNSKKKHIIKKNYYLPLINNEEIVKNNIVLDKNLIITGPNASGKTTTLKSILLNLILSQQIGYGCYKSANIPLYDYFHSYLNIPDTSGRDSLFQAEARRCLEILEFVNEKRDKLHFCIFDEIYSGTNPNDAVLCANIYLKGLNKFDNINYSLTTHYINLCESLSKEKKIKNVKMNCYEKEDIIEFTYCMKSGISKIHGGKYILKQLNYPEYLFN